MIFLPNSLYLFEHCNILYITALTTSASRVISTLVPMQNVEGGFGGGHGQLSHCAASYAAVLSLVMVGGEEALNVIDRKMLLVKASSAVTPHY